MHTYTYTVISGNLVVYDAEGPNVDLARYSGRVLAGLEALGRQVPVGAYTYDSIVKYC